MKNKLLFFAFMLSFFCSFAQTVPSYIPTNGLVSYWGFDGDANDYYSSNNGTVVGATLTSNRFGTLNKAYLFDGSSSRIVVANSATLSNFNSISISGWFNASAFLSDQGLVTKWFQQLNCSNNTDNYSCLLSNNSFTNNTPAVVGATNNYTGYTLKSVASLQTDNWYHFVFVHDNLNGGTLYINGNQSAQVSTTGALCTSTNPLIIGADNNLNTISRFFSGKLDDIGIWNRALTSAEILNIFQQASLSVNEQVLINFKVYPNPTTDNLTIENIDFNLDADYVIIDEIGREIMKGHLDAKTSIINVNSLSKGVYLLSIKGEVNRTIKFVKN